MGIGVIVANLGSPATPTRRDVHTFLAEFLSDPYVVDLPTPLRQILVRGIVAPLRSGNSSKAYETIWQWDGGPLRKFTSDIANSLERATELRTVVGMRYGEPSLKSAFEALEGCEMVILLPIYPHHADSTRTTMVKQARELAENVRLKVVPPFYKQHGYIEILSRQIVRELDEDIEHVVLSFHSLPLRHITKADPTGKHCLTAIDCCEVESQAHTTCYRHQCLWSAKAVGTRLGVPYSVAFQSRLGRLAWLEPSTIETIASIAKKGIRRVAVACPAFTVDNLETLEEIGIQARQQFESLGGEKLQLIPCLNSDPDWIEFLSLLVRNEAEANSPS